MLYISPEIYWYNLYHIIHDRDLNEKIQLFQWIFCQVSRYVFLVFHCLAIRLKVNIYFSQHLQTNQAFREMFCCSNWTWTLFKWIASLRNFVTKFANVLLLKHSYCLLRKHITNQTLVMFFSTCKKPEH